MKPRWLTAFALGCLLAVGPAAAERRDHEAHVHGSAEIDIAVLGNEVEISLTSPAMNIVGFEHAPRTGDQRRRFQEARELLRDGERLFGFGAGSCRLAESEVRRDHGEHAQGNEEYGHEGHGRDEHEHDEHGHAEEAGDEHARDEHDHEHAEVGGEAVHSEIRARYSFRCEGGIDTIETSLFEAFPATEEVRVQYLTDELQGAQRLTPEAPVLRLE